SRSISGGLIDRQCPCLDLASEIPTEELRCVQVHAATDDPRQLLLHPEEVPARGMPRLEVDQYVHIAVLADIVAQDRPKEAQTEDMVPRAELGNPFMIEWDGSRRVVHLWVPSERKNGAASFDATPYLLSGYPHGDSNPGP